MDSSSKPGFIYGRHFSTFINDVESQKKNGNIEGAEKLLLELIDATEAESRADKVGVAPWYYEELAKFYRSRKDYLKEVSILKRFNKQKHAPGEKPKKLFKRLEKAIALAAKND